MTSSFSRTGASICAWSTPPALRRACIAHRASLLKTCSPRTRTRSQYGIRSHATVVYQNVPVKEFEASGDASLPQHDDIDKKRSDLDVMAGKESTSRGRRISQRADNSRKPGSKKEPLSAGQRDMFRLDKFLPLELRSGAWVETLSGFQGVLDPSRMGDILTRAREQYPKGGALTFLALHQRRWPAFLYLAEALIRAASQAQAQSRSRDPLRDRSPLHQFDYRLSDLFKPEGMIELPGASFGQLNVEERAQTAGPLKLLQHDEMYETGAQGNLGFVWEALGHIVIEATSSEKEAAEEMMSYVHRVLAVVHNENLMHPRIYEYDMEDVPAIFRKSPLLHLMSSRIMTVISDSAWRADEDSIIDNYTWMGAAYASSGGLKLQDLYPAVRPVGAEVWLDLILWSCAYGDYTSAGTSILRKMSSDTVGRTWSTISWPKLLRYAAQEPREVTPEQLRQRFDRIAGGHEGYSKDAPAVDFPARKVSSESVTALIDAIASATPPADQSRLASDLDVIRRVLPMLVSSPSRSFWNQLILRSLELAKYKPFAFPAYLEAMSRTASKIKSMKAVIEPDTLQNQSNTMASDLASALRPLYQMVFASFVEADDLSGALRALGRVQVWLDAKRKNALQSFFSKNPDDIDTGHVAPGETETQFEMPVAPTTLSKFLDLLTKHELLKVGEWLLWYNGIDGPIITKEVRSSSLFLPALTRFALATKDDALLREVSKAIQQTERPLEAGLLHSSVQIRIGLRQYEQARAVLQSALKCGIDPTSIEDVMILASDMLHLEAKQDELSRHQICEAGRLLEDILSGVFILQRPKSIPVDMTLQRELDQLSEILVSLQCKISDFVPRKPDARRRLLRSRIAVDDFNVLMAGVVKTQGPQRGKDLFDTWCALTLPQHNQDNVVSTTEHIPVVMGDTVHQDEYAVVPNHHTVRIILQALPHQIEDESILRTLTKRETNDEVDPDKKLESLQLKENQAQLQTQVLRAQALRTWGWEILHRMGMTRAQIELEIPGMTDTYPRFTA